MVSAIISAAKLALSYYYSTTRMLQYDEDAKAAHPRPFNTTQHRGKRELFLPERGSS